MHYDVMTAMSLGNRNFSAPLQSYGTTSVYAVRRWNVLMTVSCQQSHRNHLKYLLSHLGFGQCSSGLLPDRAGELQEGKASMKDLLKTVGTADTPNLGSGFSKGLHPLWLTSTCCIRLQATPSPIFHSELTTGRLTMPPCVRNYYHWLRDCPLPSTGTSSLCTLLLVFKTLWELTFSSLYC